MDSDCESSFSHYKSTNDIDDLGINFEQDVLSQALRIPSNQPTINMLLIEDNPNASIKFLDLLHFLLNHKDDLFVWIIPNYYAVLCKLFTDKATKKVVYFEKIFQCVEVTVLTTIMRTCKLLHQYIKKYEFEEICMVWNAAHEKLIERVFFNNDLYGRLLGGYLGHSISGNQVIYIDPGKSDFKNFCVITIKTVIDELLRVVNVTEYTNSFGLESQISPRDVAIIARDDGNVELESIKESINDKSNGQWTLCTIEQYLQGEKAIPICYSKDVASLEWPVVIHIRYFKRAEIDESDNITFNCFSMEEEESVIPSRCMLQYILICPEDDFELNERTNPRPSLGDIKFTSISELHAYILYLKKLLPYLTKIISAL